MRKQQFKQKLDLKKASEGIKTANKNAKSLLDDAVLLYDNNRFARATALAILSIEESGKPSILRSILLEDDLKEINNLWKSYRKHTDKNNMWIAPELILNGGTTIHDLEKIVDKNSDHPQTLDNLKQLCFYSDAFTNCKWSNPDNLLEKEDAKRFIDIANFSLNKDELFTDELSLSLWQKHLKPSWKTNLISMKKSLIECYNECEKLQLISSGKTQEMINFLK
ncbi:AbiV family abortive infection protein [Flavobacterium sp. MEB061]|uniref:AbiV family abortive infection protein n=1 Tax=Flavobacterium sp. MEB061 TaxID=1587524 RepID=UPI0006983966|nr:AbiV family abortive infection protein [Flavobacterium sp. MEB061]